MTELRAGTNAIRCINAIFPKVSSRVKEFEYINEVLKQQAKDRENASRGRRRTRA